MINVLLTLPVPRANINKRTYFQYIIKHDDNTTINTIYFISKIETVISSSSIRTKPICEIIQSFPFWQIMNSNLGRVLMKQLS